MVIMSFISSGIASPQHHVCDFYDIATPDLEGSVELTFSMAVDWPRLSQSFKRNCTSFTREVLHTSDLARLQ